MTARHPESGQTRLTLTLPVLNHARKIYFLATGKDKAKALKAATADPPDLLNCPASAVRPVDGELNWWLDFDAAQLIS